MRLFRPLLSALNQAVDSTLQQGSAGEEIILHRLRSRLAALKARAHRLTRICGALFLLLLVALVISSFVSLDTALRAILTTVVLLMLVASALGAVESQRVTMVVDALEDLLLGGESLRPMDIVLAFRDRVLDELSEAPPWEPLVPILAHAYDSSLSARAILQRSGVPLGTIGLSQPMLYLWRDALQTAHRCRKLNALLEQVLADPLVAGYHEDVRARSAALKGGARGSAQAGR
ncbi:MAG: effector-associated domain EAD1-containing protein [Polyangiaceae bacterium]